VKWEKIILSESFNPQESESFFVDIAALAVNQTGVDIFRIPIVTKCDFVNKV